MRVDFRNNVVSFPDKNIILILQDNSGGLYNCPKCPEKFRYFSTITSHIEICHYRRLRLFKRCIYCRGCGKVFFKGEDAKNHETTYPHIGNHFSCRFFED